MTKLPAAQALQYIRKTLCKELSFVPLDVISRTYGQLFSLNDKDGKQFAIILGNLNPSTRTHKALATIIVLESCTPPSFKGIYPTNKPHKSSALNREKSKLKIQNQSVVEVADEVALKTLLDWYSKS